MHKRENRGCFQTARGKVKCWLPIRGREIVGWKRESWDNQGVQNQRPHTVQPRRNTLPHPFSPSSEITGAKRQRCRWLQGTIWKQQDIHTYEPIAVMRACKTPCKPKPQWRREMGMQYPPTPHTPTRQRAVVCCWRRHCHFSLSVYSAKSTTLWWKSTHPRIFGTVRINLDDLCVCVFF